MNIAPTHAKSNPADFLSRVLPLLSLILREGSEGEIAAAAAGVVEAMALCGVPRGSLVDVRGYPPPFGYYLTFAPDEGPEISQSDEPPPGPPEERRDLRPVFMRGDDTGLLLFPGRQGGWRHWHPAIGPVPDHEAGRLKFALLIMHRGTPRATAIHYRELFGEDLATPLERITSVTTTPPTGTSITTLEEILRRIESGSLGGAR